MPSITMRSENDLLVTTVRRFELLRPLLVAGVVTLAGCGGGGGGGSDAAPVESTPAPAAAMDGDTDTDASAEPTPANPPPPLALDVIPESRRPVWSAGVVGGIPAYAVKTSVTDYGARANDGGNDAPALQAAIDAVTPPAAVYVPAGEFHLNAPIRMRSGVVLRGAGPGATRLLMNHGDNGFDFAAFAGGSDRPVTQGADLNSRSLTLQSAAGFVPGGYGVIAQVNDPAKLYTQAGWNQSWAQEAVGQMFRVVAVSGNRITLEAPLSIQFDPAFAPRARPLTDIVENAGLEDLALTRLDSSDRFIVRIRQGANLWFRNIASHRARKAHIHAREGYRIEVRDSYFHDASDHGVGGHGYGVMLSRHSSHSLIENNIFRRLRHALILQIGASGNVMAYNYVREALSEGNYVPTDISLHGHYPSANLFEGNVVDLIGIGDFWGPAGPWNTFHRNRVGAEGIYLHDHSDFQNITANVLNTRSGREIRWDGTVDPATLLVHMNLQNGLLLLADQVPVDALFPDSYFHAARPDFYDNRPWPSIGPDAAAPTNPAEQRYLAGDFPAFD